MVVAGIYPHYNPEELIDKEVILLYNLKPKRIFGIESQGMLLAVDDGEKLSLIVPEREVKEGSKVR